MLQAFTEAFSLSFSFVSKAITLESLADHILSGGKFAHASFTRQQKKGEFFESSQSIVFDFDAGVSIAQLLKNSFVRDYGWLIYATPSSTTENPKTRLVFVLDQPVTNAKQWVRLARGSYEFFLNQFASVPNLNIDRASFKVAQSWAGSTNRVEQPYINHAARLPIVLIPLYNEPKPTPIVVGQGEIAGDVLTAIEQALGISRYKSDGWSLPIGCPFKQHEYDSTTPAAAWHNDKHILYCQKCQKQWLAKDTAAALGIEWPSRPKRSVQHSTKKQENEVVTKAARRGEALEFAQARRNSAKAALDDLRTKKKQRVAAQLPRPPLTRIADLAERQAEQTRRNHEDEFIAAEAAVIKAMRRAYEATGNHLAVINSRWQWKRYPSLDHKNDTRQVVEHINDDLPPSEMEKYRSLLIVGGTGLGKSHAVGAYASSLPEDAKTTAAAQFRLLLQGLRKYFPNADHYEDTAPGYQTLLSHTKQLLTSVSSASKFNRNNSDLLVLDELAGVLKFLVSSDTFKKDEAINAFRAVKQWVSSAVQFTGMDANISSIEMDWINGLRGNDATVKSYRRAELRGKVTLLRDCDTATWQIKKLLMDKCGQVYVACSSEKKATAHFDLFSGGEYRTFKITRDTSNTPEVARFIADPAYRAQFDLVIYDPAMGSGVDISEPVYALVGIFDRTPLAPESAIQLFGRIRNVHRYYAAVPAEGIGYETPTAAEIKAVRLKREYWTAKRTGQVATQSGIWLEMLDLWSKYQERHLREVARWRPYFVERLQHNGYEVQSHEVGVSEELRALLSEWRNERKENDWQFILEAAGQALSDAALDKIRLSRQEITHEHRLKNTRHKIETVLGSKAVNEKDSDLISPQKRGALYRAIGRRNGDTLERDAVESVEGVPLQKRHYSHAALAVMSNLLTSMGFEGNPAQQDELFLEYFLHPRSKSELDEKFAILTGDEATKQLKMLGHQTENANSVLGRLKWIMDYLWGVKPQGKQTGPRDGRYMIYWLDSATVTYLIARRDLAAAVQRKKQSVKRTTNLLNKTPSRFVVQPQKSNRSLKEPVYTPQSEPPSPPWIPPTPRPYIRAAATEATHG